MRNDTFKNIFRLEKSKSHGNGELDGFSTTLTLMDSCSRNVTAHLYE